MNTAKTRKKEAEMNNLKLSFEMVMPLVLYMLVGAFMKKTGILNKETGDKLTGIVHSILLPIMLFKNMYNSDIGESAGPLMLYTFGAISFMLVFCIIIFTVLEKNPGKRGSYIMGTCRGNTALFGLVVAAQLFDDDGIAVTALITTVLVIFCNVASVIVYEIYGAKEKLLTSGGAEQKLAKISLLTLLKDLAKNRLIWGIILGFAFKFAKIAVPGWIMTSVNGLANTASPLSFLVLGATFSLKAALPEKRNLIIAILVKLILMPALFIVLPLSWGWAGTTIVALVIQAGSPTAVSCYPMSKAAGCDSQVSGDIVTLTTSFTMLTMFLWVFALKSFGVF